MRLDASASPALLARVRHVIVPAKTLNKQLGPGLTALKCLTSRVRHVIVPAKTQPGPGFTAS